MLKVRQRRLPELRETACGTQKSLGIHEPLLRMAVRELGDASHLAQANAASAARSVLSAQLMFAVILVQQSRALSLIAGKYSCERVLATNGPAPTRVFLDPVSKVEELENEAALFAIAGTGGGN
jgi:hypothetical protein